MGLDLFGLWINSPVNKNSVTTLDDLLARGIKEMKLSVSQHQFTQLRGYVDLLLKWNRVYNLTAVRNPEEMISRHLLDSLSVLPFVEALIGPGGSLIDVGSGPGLPGLPLAIMLPDRNISTLDCIGKKTRFQVQVCAELAIGNVTVINERVENWQPKLGYDAVISRAFSSLRDMVAGTDHLLRDEGQWLAMKGIHPKDELQDLARDYPHVAMTASHRLDVAGCDGQRHLVTLARTGEP